MALQQPTSPTKQQTYPDGRAKYRQPWAPANDNVGLQYGSTPDLRGMDFSPIGSGEGRSAQVGGGYTPPAVQSATRSSPQLQPGGLQSKYEQAIQPYQLDTPIEAQWAVEDAPMIQRDAQQTIEQYGIPQGDTTATTQSDRSNLMEGLGTIANVGTSVAQQQAQANANMAASEYANDLNYWKDQGKYWFDPNAELMPDLEAYVGQMPSATDALKDSTLLGGVSEDSTTAQILLNPAGVLGEQGTYVGEKAIDRAIEGFAVGGGWGAVAGAAVGVIEGLFNWSDAQEADKKAKARALAEYDRKVQEWVARRNKQIREQNKIMQTKRLDMQKNEQAAKARAKEKAALANQMKRAEFGQSVARAEKDAQANRSDFINQWNRR